MREYLMLWQDWEEEVIMFFDLVSKNSKRDRKENGLLFSTLVISIVAFYLILSLSHQDVMIFLKRMESDAVNKLMMMIPLFYGMTLFILFFLVYFASRYQIESRSHEFGVYLMMGMRRYRLFMLLLFEDVRNTLFALITGIPIGIALAEIISLVTVKMVGIGIIDHSFSISLEAIIFTIIGFVIIKFMAFAILSGKVIHRQIGELLNPRPAGSKKQHNRIVYILSFIFGMIMLVYAYVMAIRGLSWYNVRNMSLTYMAGFVGIICIFYGLRVLMNTIAKKNRRKQTLHTFTFRQLEEAVIQKSASLAISSILMLAGLCCFGSGIAIAKYYGSIDEHIIDYTFAAYQNDEADNIRETLKNSDYAKLFDTIFDIEIGYIRKSEDYDNAYLMPTVIDELNAISKTANNTKREDIDVLLNNFSYTSYPYLISQSGYNELLKLKGEEELSLKDNEVCMYIGRDSNNENIREILNGIIAKRPEVSVDGEPFVLTGRLYTDNIVVDRSVTLSFALIVNDSVFEELTLGDTEIYTNATLSPSLKKGKSLIRTVMDANEELNGSGLVYESYLQNMGRKLFYRVAASYITIYLAIVFIIVANTIIGVQFLTNLRKTGRRYQTLIKIGASYEALCYSADKQINWYFGIPVIMAAINSIFGVRALFTGILSGRTAEDTLSLMIISLAMILVMCVIELIYIIVVRKAGESYILSLMTLEREE